MIDITTEVRRVTDIPVEIELLWAQNHDKVILFKNGEPESFVNLSNYERDRDNVVKSALTLLNKGGVIFA